MINPFWGNIFEEVLDPALVKTEDFLVQIPLFTQLTKRELKKIAVIVHRRHYQKDELMFEMNHPGAAMFIIKTGSIKIVIPSEGGGEIELAELKSGAFLGELALLDDSPRSASARVSEESIAYAFFRSDLNKLIDSDPVIGSKILKELAVITGQRLKATNKQLFAKKD
ncbi:MAG: cyclic nucleotide-binding domain-containing protein [SAR324 cluster bacterium]|nr:cyclic nucleotide-binding domain-containing protein [SAR324 cluster bacterium]